VGGGSRDDNEEAAAKSSDAATAVAATTSNGTSATPSVSLPLASLPAFIADQASALAADAPSATSAAATTSATPKAAQAVKELQISLEPADLGEMTLELRLADGKLSVTIAVANPKTLGAIEDDRALIAARLGAGDQTLEDLVIQRQTAAPATPETASSHVIASESGADPSTSDGEANSANPGGRRAGARAGSAFSDLLV
jgi:hypothetical protein